MPASLRVAVSSSHWASPSAAIPSNVHQCERRATQTSERIGHSAPVLNGSRALDQSAHPFNLRFGAGRPLPSKEVAKFATLGNTGVLQRVDNHQRALVLEKVAVRLFAVFGPRFEVK